MALYTILFGLSIFMIAMVLAIIRKVFFHWKEEHKIERIVKPTVQRPSVSAMIYIEKCVFKKRKYAGDLLVYDLISKSDISLSKENNDKPK